MADVKISALADGSPALGTDETVVARSGANKKLSLSAIATYIAGIIGGTNWVTKTSGFTAASGDRILADTSGAAFTITLPATPSANDTVTIKSGASAATNNLTVARNGSTIMGLAENLTISTPSVEFTLVYGSTWQL